MKEKSAKKALSLILSICLMVSTMFVTSTVAYAGSEYLPSGYVTDSNGIMAYTYNTMNNTFDVYGHLNSWLQTTCGNSGFSTLMKVGSETCSFIEARAEGVDYNNLNVKVTFSFENDGKLLGVIYTIKNNAEEETTFSIASCADVQIGNDDCALITPFDDGSGFKMVNQNTGDDKDSQFNFFGKGMPGATDVDTFWYGKLGNLYSDFYNNVFSFTPANSESGTFDSAISYAWNNRTIKAGETQTLKIYIGIGGPGSEVSSRHTHSFTYTLDKTTTDNDTIKATCTNSDGKCGLTGSDKSVSLKLSATSPTYSGSAATINIGTADEQTAWTNAGLTLPAASDVKYYIGSTLLPSAPTTAGTYTAKVTVGGVTASVDYTISKLEPTATAPVAVSLTYNGSAQALVTAGSTSNGTLQYSLTKDGSYKDAIPTATNAGTYNVYYKVVGDSEHSDKVFDTPVAVTIAKANYTGTKEVSGNILAGYASSGEIILPTIPENMIYGTPTTTASQISDLSLADGKLTYKGSASVLNGTDYSITIPVIGENGANYSDYNITVTLIGKNCTHTFGVYKSNNDATTAKDGTKTRTCSVCGYKETVTDEGSKLPSNENGTVKVPEEKQKDNFGSGELSGSTNDIKSAVLTDDDKKAISEGKDINIWIEVKDSSSTVSQSDKTAVENKMPENYSIGAYLDINLWKQITGSDATKVTELPNGKVKITITIPSDLQKSGRTYKAIRIHDGVATVLDATVDANYELTFETDCFSTYAIVYQDKASSDNGKDTTSPKTGDTNNVWFWLFLMIASLGIVGFTMLYGKKRIQRNEDN